MNSRGTPLIRHQAGEIEYYQLGLLARYSEVVHAVSTRRGGVSRAPYSSLNIGHATADQQDAVDTNRSRLCNALGISPGQVVLAQQTHGTSVAMVDASHIVGNRRPMVSPEADALVTRRPGIFLLLTFADCVPLLLYDPVQRAMGLAHAGWRGTVGKVALETVRAMERSFGSRPADIVAGIGPSIGPCCYQVGEEVAQEMADAFPSSPGLVAVRDRRCYLDLRQANLEALREAGVRQTEVVALCTACHTDLFFSHRAEGGTTGRFAVIIGLRHEEVMGHDAGEHTG